MGQKVFLLFFFLSFFCALSQEKPKELRIINITTSKDTIRIDSVSINPSYFKILKNNNIVPQKNYKVNFIKGELYINAEKYKNITVEYLRYPDFITKVYTPINDSIIVENTGETSKVYKNKSTKNIVLFEGLKPQGYINRGITSGNNQNVVTSSSLNLTLEGKINKHVKVRANIFDTNFPLQQNGYSQNITDFDRIFVELYGKKWSVKGGDIHLENKDSYFLNFNKQISGVSASINPTKNTSFQVSGAIVRGQFDTYKITPIEGNHGPYQLYNRNEQQRKIIIANSERVFVNGQLKEKGENKDYVINYNLAEIKFNTSLPITSDMRIRVEFQYANNNYTRFVTFEKGTYQSKKISISGYFYNENDAKTQPLQQKLSDKEIKILQKAGNNIQDMVGESAYEDTYDANRIQYKKENGIFIFSKNQKDKLYTVQFTNLGTNLGDYIIAKNTAIGPIFKFAGTNKGTHLPIKKIIAPSKLQVAAIKTKYLPSKNTKISTEIAFSNNDLNLFSSIGDEKNKQVAAKLDWHQILLNNKWKLLSNLNVTYVQEHFKTVQRFQNIEFERNWNVNNNQGTQHISRINFLFEKDRKNFVTYGIDYLNFSENYRGIKQLLKSKVTFKNTTIENQGSWLKNTSTLSKGDFFRWKSNLKYYFKKYYFATKIHLERNKQQDRSSQQLNPLSFQFKEYEASIGTKDSVKSKTKLGIIYRTNDSIKNNHLTEINNRKSVYFSSNLIDNNQTKLSVFANYQLTNYSFQKNQKSFNSKIEFNQQLFNNLIQLRTNYETVSGSLAQQKYQYIETEKGQGYYTWIDYNNDGIKDFDEFEIAQFRDQANYLRLPLPNVVLLPTQQVSYNQSITFNLAKWKQHKGIQKLLSRIHNQLFINIINKKTRRIHSFNFNPFDINNDNIASLYLNVKNNLYYNKNKQNFSWIYSYHSSENFENFDIGTQKTKLKTHQLEFIQRLSKNWLLNITGSKTYNKLTTQNFLNRNYKIGQASLEPKLTFQFNQQHRFATSYTFNKKTNTINSKEQLLQHKINTTYTYSFNKKNQFKANFSTVINDFQANTNSPVAYQMLEGLQKGNNYLWNVLYNQQLNNLLHLNISYLGRNHQGNRTIHTGNISLKAIF